MLHLIVAGSNAEASEWARRNGSTNWRYVGDPYVMMGMRPAPHIELVLTGSWQTSYYACDIVRHLHRDRHWGAVTRKLLEG